MGWPANYSSVPGVAVGNLSDLIGESVSLPCMTTVLSAVLASPGAPWWAPEDGSAAKRQRVAVAETRG